MNKGSCVFGFSTCYATNMKRDPSRYPEPGVVPLRPGIGVQGKNTTILRKLRNVYKNLSVIVKGETGVYREVDDV